MTKQYVIFDMAKQVYLLSGGETPYIQDALFFDTEEYAYRYLCQMFNAWELNEGVFEIKCVAIVL